MDRREWLLKRNCSLTPRQTIMAFALVCGLTLSSGLVFLLLHGAWMVFGFAIVEVLAAAAAFLHYARHATDCEHIALAGDCLLVEQFNAGEIQRTRLDLWRVRVTPPSKERDMIVIEACGIRVEVGRFVTEAVRKQVAQELQKGLCA